METTQLHHDHARAELVVRKYDLCLSVERRPFRDTEPVAIGKCDCAGRGGVPMDRYELLSPSLTIIMLMLLVSRPDWAGLGWIPALSGPKSGNRYYITTTVVASCT